jgi:transposase
LVWISRNQSRRLLSLAAVRDGMDRGEAARIGRMDRQTLRDWVHRFNKRGPNGLSDNWKRAEVAAVAGLVGGTGRDR